MNSPLFFLALFLLSSVSSAHRILDINLTPFDHDHTHHDQKSEVGADGKILLPSEPLPPPEVTHSPVADRLAELGVDITELLTNRPLNTRYRLGVPFIHYLPRRFRHVNHHNLLSRHPSRPVGLGHAYEDVRPLDELNAFLKHNADVIHHRHVSSGFPDPQIEQSFIPLHRDAVDPTVEVKTREEKHEEVKSENGEEHRGDHHHQHHDDHVEEKRDDDNNDDLMNKIRKFLVNF